MPLHLRNRGQKRANAYLVFKVGAGIVAALFVAKTVKANDINTYRADLGYKDGIVNFADFAILASNWGQTGQGDLNEDGVVDFNDVGALASVWGETYTPIRTIEDVNDLMRKNPDGFFVLINDVNAYETASWNDGAGFEPIGKFTGTFRGGGGGNTISGLTMIWPFESDVGLFSVVDANAVVYDIGIKDAYILGSSSVGAVAGKLANGTVSDIRIEDAYIRGSSAVGTVAGTFADGTIEKVASSGVVEATDRRAGGITGIIYQGTIMNCSFEGDVKGTYFLGGIAGDAELQDPNGTPIYIINCRSGGDVNGLARRMGGLIGRVVDSNVANCLSTSKVYGDTKVGGLIGENRNDSSTITNSYFTDSNHPCSDPNLCGTECDVNDLYDPDHAVYAGWDPNIWEWHQDTNELPTLREPEEPSAKDTKEQEKNSRPNIHLLLRQEQPYMTAKNQQLNKGRLPTRAFDHKAHYRRAYFLRRVLSRSFAKSYLSLPSRLTISQSGYIF